MPFLNYQSSVLIYEDAGEKTPLRRTPDLTLTANGLQVGKDKSERITVYPNEIVDILVKTRSLSWTSSTELTWVRPQAAADLMRIKYTGTGPNPVFRTARALGTDATTVLTMSRVSPNAVKIQHVSGTAWSLGTVAVNDLIRFEPDTDAFTNPFGAIAGNTYRVQAVGADYVEFVDNGLAPLAENITLGADFALAVRIMTAGPVRIGDKISVSGAGINQGNIGDFEITDVSADYIEFVSPFGVAQTTTFGTNLLTVYDRLIGFVVIRTEGPTIKLRFGGQTEWVELKSLDGGVTPPIMMATISTYKIQATNDGTDPVDIMITHAESSL